MTQNNKTQPVIIRKYANRRLYNTQISSYVTLDDLCLMVKNHEDFIVQDAKSGEDLTKQVLTQIIFEQENNGENILSPEFLRGIIRFYDNSLKNVVPVYLNTMMEAFIQNQDEMRRKMESGSTDFTPFSQFGDIYKSVWQNQQEMFNKTFDIFSSYNPLMNPQNPNNKEGK